MNYKTQQSAPMLPFTAPKNFTPLSLPQLLTLARPHGSDPEWWLAGELCRWLEAHKNVVAATTFTCPRQDQPYAYTATVGSGSKTLFSCHIDTVHRAEGLQVIESRSIDGRTFACLPEDSPSSCLGADDSAGIWIMCWMIERGIAGTYIFHRGEERGGIGSKGMAEHHADWLRQFDRAVAFDRKATHSVITHQGMGRCCSDDFALQLADALNAALPEEHAFMSPDDSGVYTDTAEYTALIPECTNVSCGYYDEHTSAERLDLEFVHALRDACCAVDWDALPTVREAREEPSGFWWEREPADTSRWDNSAYYEANWPDLFDGRDPIDLTEQDVADWVRESDPRDVARLICDLIGDAM